jgi:hypothetical protein
MTDWHPEFEEDSRPLRTERRRRMLRVVVLVALGAMLLPLVLSAVGVARSAAERACVVYASAYDASASFRVAFDAFAEGGPGWLCFARPSGAGHDTLLGNLGLMPSAPRFAEPGRAT